MWNRSLVVIVSVTLILQGCASVPYSCEETCAKSGMVCRGQTIGQSTSGGYAFVPGGTSPVIYSGGGDQISFMCEKPTGTESDAQISAAYASAIVKDKENQTRHDQGIVAGIIVIIATIIGSAAAISSYNSSH